MSRHFTLSIIPALLLGSGLALAGPEPAADEAAELAALLDTLDELTEIATRNRMNSDYVPGMVSVLHGERLEAQGIHTVWQALGLVSGLEIARNNFGEPLVLVRGVGQALNSGNLKVMLNSVPMNNDLDGRAHGVFGIPVTQVERIEVYRGPGSALYGEYAYSGVVNVITRKEGGRLDLRAAGHDIRGLGGRLSWDSPSKQLRLFGNLSGWRRDGSGLTMADDAYTALGFGNAPGPIDDREGNRLLILGAEYDGFTLLAQAARYEHGDWYGHSALPPDPPLDIGVSTQRTLSLDKRWSFSPELELHGRLYHMDYDSDAPERLMVPAGYGNRIPPAAPQPPPGAPVPLAPLEGLVSNQSSDLRRHGVEAEIAWSGWRGHRWLVGLGYADTEVTDSAYLENGVPMTMWLPGVAGSLPVGVSRRLLSVTAQDQWMVTDTLELTGGLRYDDYSDVGESVTPRLAAVWRMDDHHLFKAQYAEAFRPPTLGELHEGTPQRRRLKPELLDSLELSYIYRAEASRFQATLFRSDLKDLIEEMPGPDRLRNIGGLRQRGIELEWERPLGGQWRLGGNIAYTDSEEIRAGFRAQGSARWLGNLTLNGRIAPKWSLDGRLNLAVDRAGWPRNENEPLEDYVVVSIGVSGRDVGVEGLILRAGIDNLFDERVEYLAQVGTYLDNLQQPGRSAWLQLSYEFR